MLAVVLPARGRLPTLATLAAIAVGATAIFVVGSLLAVLATLVVVAWWVLSHRRRGRPEPAEDASALD